MMISLRLLEGVNLTALTQQFGETYLAHTKTIVKALQKENKIKITNNGFAIEKHARFLADGIASEFFIV
jgi:coproporphyrinogen III oxidase-like Fe-S oxidoreductase